MASNKTNCLCDPGCIQFYFDKRASNYWLRYGQEPFLNLDWRNVVTHLRANLIRVDEPVDLSQGKDDTWDYGLKLGDKMRMICQRERAVDYAGALAGYKMQEKPITTSDGKKILITSDPKIPEPKKGDCDFLEEFFCRLFGADSPDKDDQGKLSKARIGSEQFTFLCNWIKFAYESLTAGTFRPGQALTLAGDGSSGKSFAVWIIAQIFGGRTADPWRYMTEKTPFNSDLAEAEILVCDDPTASVDIRARRQLGDAIKQMTVVDTWSVHRKGQQAVNGIRTFKRLLLAFNSEPEKLGALPPLDADMLDKIALLRCFDAKGVLNDDRLKNQAAALKEIPAFLWKCLNAPVKKELRHARYGVTAYHNPELLDMLNGLAPESRLLDFIDEALNGEPWKGAAAELERKLITNETFGWQAQKLLSHSSTCGTLLSRLEKKTDRIQSTRSKGKTTWSITPGEKDL